LELVTHRENMLRGNTFAAQNAQKTHCKKGHKFTAENTLMRESDTGPARVCIQCRQIHNQRRRQERARIKQLEQQSEVRG
jgi:hypothetical protein